MSSAPAYWGHRIAVEEIGGVPFRMYAERPTRIGDLLAFAERWGTRPYIVQGDRVLTFAGLTSAVSTKTRALAATGIKRGDHVFVLGWNSPEWVVNFWACVHAGAVPVAANAWWSEGEFADALRALKPELTLADPRGADKMSPAWRRGPWETELDPTDAAAEAIPDPDAALISEGDPAVIIFTSGTEGRPKAVVLAHRSLLASLQMLLHISRRLPQQIDETAGEVILHTGPLFHIGGVGALLRGVTVGNTLVMPQGRFDPADALVLIERHKISRWNAVPTMATRLLEHPDVHRRDLRSLRAITLGGTPVHAELLKLMRSGLRGVDVRIAMGYGLSENCGQATAASAADTADRPGSCGRPLPCVELKIVARPGIPDGEVLLRSPSQMLGYFGEEESPIDREGWLHTGDLGRVDSDGHLWITGRCKDIIIRGGENIAPAAVERALLAIPGVSEAAVFGMPHPDLGEEVTAVVVAEGETSPDRLQEHLHKSLASFAVPSRWLFRSEKLPVNLTGKIDKAALKAEARAARNRRASDLVEATRMQSFQHVTATAANSQRGIVSTMAQFIERSEIFVGGQWVRSAGNDVISVINPATETAIATIPRGTAEDVDRAARAASAAFMAWSQTPVAERAAIFGRLARLTESRADEITRTIVSEVGQPISSAVKSQTVGAVEELDLIAECLPEIAWAESSGRAVVRREAAGVVGAITAWNAPLRSIISKAGAAIAAGCTVVLKGSEVAPLTSFIFVEMAAEAGLPDGVINLVCGTGPEVGEAIVTHPLMDMVSLTGSVRAGRRVMELAAAAIKRVHLELGGKSANIILEDADLERAIAVGIDDAFRNAGQVCGGLTRMLVPRGLLRAAEELAVTKAESYVIGDPFDPATTLGPVTTAGQRERVRSYIRNGIADGERMLTGGPEAPAGFERGWFVRPTLFSCDNNARIAREEIFGPVVVIIPFEDEEDALAIANDSPYGLAGGIWCADAAHARTLASRLRVGRVRINGAPLDKRAPHGGFKLSGIGREWGRYGIEEFLEYKSVIG